jgi:hypothetical protein
MFHLIKDHCWFFVKGAGSIIASASLLFAWFVVFLMLKRRDRIIFAILSLLIFAIAPLEPGSPVAAAKSRAANLLRITMARLEEQRSAAQKSAYPPTLVIETRGYEERYYRYAYVPIRSHPDSTIDDFLLTARPRRYGCGSFASFTVASDGKFHMTKEDREANKNDPTLN